MTRTRRPRRPPLTKAEKTPAKHPTGAPDGRCLPAHGRGPFGRENILCPRAGGTWSNNISCLTKFLLQQSRADRAIPTISGRAPAKSCSNAYPAFERFRYLRRGARGLRRLPLRRAGGASRHSVWAIRATKTGSVRALAEIDQTTHVAWSISYSSTRARCRSAREPGCVYPNKGPRRDANASAAEARP